MTEVLEPPALKTIDTVLNGIAFICRVVTGLSLVVLTVIFGWLVYGRYVLNDTPTWVEQTALLLVMTIAFLGAAVGTHENTHLAVTMVRSALAPRLRLIVLGVTDIILGGFGLLMLYYGAELTLFKWGSSIPLINVPEGLRSLPLTISGGLIVLFSAGHIVRLLTGRDRRVDVIQ
ncbi:MAG: TRAP transporter small permease [Pseudomonadota bacterium]